ncbi:hypothetical protein CcaverHIS002_0102460 [Cutaneotrichosporon cavernicola]|uniref:BTB domain-containing protein n=1 Tax=Cutaneotrichosporon cavernicola TaxID=279322 RepID=A0AA48I167_9TREE|nr:uncharacterized protein CcaverHIS019_0102400 [Cutaneotrichosporon cavernicola]BEI79717.1 hypothetical protein CcaverHIS002_0102460 [Cutaneotrichosporon cavernicola]BEI87522.1 hypothetical protein CcaverHIS019_0102400 [Cutaneotrichosporon cavernicola]BEI95293.1 hypothetical protein CcaverHIS631_0102420 [Cutaneotrichosporon cavernicola]BEJ03067.1 hypothetical protein CcaverHIS641_0102420 [Cutaneotrichosporon cavernicola]
MPISTTYPPLYTISHPPPTLSKVAGSLPGNEETLLLFSADRIPFRIPTHQLATASTAFLSSSSLNRAGQRQLRFSDPRIETSSILNPFSELILDAGLTSPTLLKLNVATATGLVRFLQKWDCPGLLRLALACMHHGYTAGAVKSWVIFMAACVAEDADIVASMLNDPRHGGWKREGLSKAADDLTLDIDVRGYPFEWWAMVPAGFQWAVGKAMTYGDKYPQSVRGRGDVFRELLKAAKA